MLTAWLRHRLHRQSSIMALSVIKLLVKRNINAKDVIYLSYMFEETYVLDKIYIIVSFAHIGSRLRNDLYCVEWDVKL